MPSAVNAMFWYRWYNSGRVHKSLPVTPAMAGSIADHVWIVRELQEAAWAATIPNMKTESEIRTRLQQVRKDLESIEKHRKSLPRGGGQLAIKRKRVLEGERGILAWVLDESDPGPSPTTW